MKFRKLGNGVRGMMEQIRDVFKGIQQTGAVTSCIRDMVMLDVGAVLIETVVFCDKWQQVGHGLLYLS